MHGKSRFSYHIIAICLAMFIAFSSASAQAAENQSEALADAYWDLVESTLGLCQETADYAATSEVSFDLIKASGEQIANLLNVTVLTAQELYSMTDQKIDSLYFRYVSLMELHATNLNLTAKYVINDVRNYGSVKQQSTIDKLSTLTSQVYSSYTSFKESATEFRNSVGFVLLGTPNEKKLIDQMLACSEIFDNGQHVYGGRYTYAHDKYVQNAPTPQLTYANVTMSSTQTGIPAVLEMKTTSFSALTYSINWYKNGVLQATQTAPSVEMAENTPGLYTSSAKLSYAIPSAGNWHVVATGTDKLGKTVTYTSNTITVTQAPVYPTAISLNTTGTTLEKGKTLQLSVSFTPANTTLKGITWSSSNAAVATVSSNGLVTAVSEGTATIKATSTANSALTASATIQVSNPVPSEIPVTALTLNPGNAVLDVGASITLTASVSPANATNKTITWASSNPAVATINGGVVKAISPGSAVITASAVNGVSARADISVNTPTHTTFNIISRISGKANPAVVPGVFDLYLDGVLAAQAVSSYSGTVKTGTAYSIRNIVSHAGYLPPYGELSGSVTYEASTIYLDYSENENWIYASTLPAGITSDLFNIEYRQQDETIASTSPGTDWIQGDLVSTTYTPSGAAYESDLPLDVSETRKLSSWYYFHWCGTSGNAAEHYQTDKYIHFDSISNTSSVTVVSSATDGLDSRYTYYDLNWTDGSKAYCKSGVTCDGAYGSHAERCHYWYKMYVYQNYTPVYSYRYTKDSGWSSSTLNSYTQVRYALKSIPDEKRLILPDSLISLDDEAFTGIRAAEVVIPDGTKSIGARAFADCRSLQLVRIPASVSTIAQDAFDNCGSLIFITEAGSPASAFAENHGFTVIPE